GHGGGAGGDGADVADGGRQGDRVGLGGVGGRPGDAGHGEVRVGRGLADDLELGDLPAGRAAVGGEPQPHVGGPAVHRDGHAVAGGGVEGVSAGGHQGAERAAVLGAAEHL